MLKKPVISTSLNRPVQSDSTPMMLKKVAKPMSANNTLLKTREKTGANPIVQKASASATRLQSVKSGAAPSLANRGERTSATATVLHQAVKPGATPTVLRTGEKSSTAATNRTVQASTTRAALKNVAQPGPTNPSP